MIAVLVGHLTFTKLHISQIRKSFWRWDPSSLVINYSPGYTKDLPVKNLYYNNQREKTGFRNEEYMFTDLETTDQTRSVLEGAGLYDGIAGLWLAADVQLIASRLNYSPMASTLLIRFAENVCILRIKAEVHAETNKTSLKCILTDILIIYR